MAKDKAASGWKVGDHAIDTVFRNYLVIVELDDDGAVCEFTQEGLAGSPFRLPLERLMAVPE